MHLSNSSRPGQILSAFFLAWRLEERTKSCATTRLTNPARNILSGFQKLDEDSVLISVPIPSQQSDRLTVEPSEG